LEGHVEEFGHTLGEELLVPTRIYARDCLALTAETGVRMFAHITGGGLARNLVRVLPDGVEAVVERGSWTPAPVFKMIAARGRVERAEMEKTFNMGVGMVAVMPPDDGDRALALLTARHVPARVLGEVRRPEERQVAPTGGDPRVGPACRARPAGPLPTGALPPDREAAVRALVGAPVELHSGRPRLRVQLHAHAPRVPEGVERLHAVHDRIAAGVAELLRRHGRGGPGAAHRTRRRG